MAKLDFLETIDLEMVRANGKRSGIIRNFAMERAINTIWAPAGGGKTSFCFALAYRFATMGFEIAYIDTDNGVDILQDRGYDKQIELIGQNFRYINADALDNPRAQVGEILERIKNRAGRESYNGCVFFFDSLKFFLNGGVYDEAKIDKFVEFAKSIRRAGGSVWILNHSLKNGTDMKGGQSLTDAVDEQWELEGLGVDEKEAHYVLHPKKYRMKVAKVGFSVDIKSLKMREIDPVIAGMSSEERVFCDDVRSELAKHESGISQNLLLERLKRAKDDRAAIGYLKEHTGRFWVVENGKNRAKVYKVQHLQHLQHPTT